MSNNAWMNKFRPKTFSEVHGQQNEIEVCSRLITDNWTVSSLVITGPFGTGKTTLARILARSFLCDDRDTEEYEPCGKCTSCKMMDRESHPNYVELDAASEGNVQQVRAMKEEVSYRTGVKKKIIVYDESHMLSIAAQNALLLTLEEGVPNTLFIFCTTDIEKMLPTICSRSVVLRLRLLKANEIKARLKSIADQESLEYDEKSLGLIATYVKGHLRDAVGTLEQLSRMKEGVIDEGLTRTYLRLERSQDAYDLLLEDDERERWTNMERILCELSVTEFVAIVGEVLVNAKRHNLGVGEYTQLDSVLLKKIWEKYGDQVVTMAERLLTRNIGYSSINGAVAFISNALFKEETVESIRPRPNTAPKNSLSGLMPQGKKR